MTKVEAELYAERDITARLRRELAFEQQEYVTLQETTEAQAEEENKMRIKIEHQIRKLRKELAAVGPSKTGRELLTRAKYLFDGIDSGDEDESSYRSVSRSHSRGMDHQEEEEEWYFGEPDLCGSLSSLQAMKHIRKVAWDDFDTRAAEDGAEISRRNSIPKKKKFGYPKGQPFG